MSAKRRWRGGGKDHPLKNLMWMIQGGRCFFCDQEVSKRDRHGRHGHSVRTIDHLVPRSVGGTSIVVGACFACNNRKGDDIPDVEQLRDFVRLLETSEFSHLAHAFRNRALEEANYWIARSNPENKEVQEMSDKITLEGVDKIQRSANTMAGAAERIAQAAATIAESNNRFLSRYEALVTRIEKAAVPDRRSFFEQIFG